MNGKKIVLATLLTIFLLPLGIQAEDSVERKTMVQHPERYLKITDWSYFTAGRVAMLSHVVIENTADIAYKDIKIKVNLYATQGSVAGQSVTSTKATLPVTVPPKSKDKYLKGGTVIGAGNQSYVTKYIQVLDATPVR